MPALSDEKGGSCQGPTHPAHSRPGQMQRDKQAGRTAEPATRRVVVGGGGQRVPGVHKKVGNCGNAYNVPSNTSKRP